MSNLKDPNEQYNTIKEQISTMLIEYDEYVRDSHKDIIHIAENMVKNTPMEIRKPEPHEPMKYYRYMTSPVFRTTVDSLTSYIMSTMKG